MSIGPWPPTTDVGNLLSDRFRNDISVIIDCLMPLMKDVSLQIWREPELAYEEHFASNLIARVLGKEGFQVQQNYHLPTAFRAEFSTKEFDEHKHRTLAFICEYDALPGLGHACGHNLIAILGLSSALALKRFLELHDTLDLQCKVVCLGTPAEETTGGKIDLLKTNCFDNIDFALMAHPSGRNEAAPTILGLLECEVEFSTATEAGETAEGAHGCAVDAAVSLHRFLTTHRQHLKAGQQIHGVIYHADQKYAKSHYYLRTPTAREMENLKRHFVNAVESATLLTGCANTQTFAEVPFVGLLSNEIMANVYEIHAKNLGFQFPKDLPPAYGSTDMGNVSYRVPSIHPFYRVDNCNGGPGANIPSDVVLIHTKEFGEVSGTDKAILSTLNTAKSLVLCALELVLNEELAQNVKAVFKRSVAENS